MTSSQRRALRNSPPCACGHARDEHRYQPQEHACPVGGCSCTGYHLPGEPMPVPMPKPEPEPVAAAPTPPHRPRLQSGGLALMTLLLMGASVPAPPPMYPKRGQP